MNKLLTTIIVLLALHLWYCNADLLILSREMALPEGQSLSVFTYTVLILFALSYSVLSAVSVVKMQKYVYVGVFSLLDGIAVYMRINVDQIYFLYIVSAFYAVYTAYIITVVWLMNRDKVAKEGMAETLSPMAISPEQSKISGPDKDILISCKRRIAGSHNNPAMIEKVIMQAPEPIKQELKSCYGKFLDKSSNQQQIQWN